MAESFLPQLIALATKHLHYGLVHAWHPDEASAPDGPRPGGTGLPWMLLSSHSLTEYLPNLWWAQIFGPPWVELFGAATLASTPAYRVEEVAPAHWLVQLTEPLSDVADTGDARAEFLQVRERCKQHLGADAFYDPARGAYATYRTPVIPDLLDRGLVPPPPEIG